MLKAIIIDDEYDSREALRMAVEKYCEEVEIVASCESPEAGLSAIQTLRPDLIFLDIQMPHMSGFDLLNRIDPIDFEVIFVTAYDRYAIKAIKFSALDYLLKPVDIDELLTAVQRVRKKAHDAVAVNHYKSIIENVKSHGQGLGKLAIPTVDGIIFVKIKEITYCEADRNYTILYFSNQEKIIVSKTLKEFESILEDKNFFRVHNSYLINLQHIQKYIKGEGGYVILSDGSHVDVSRRKKEEFLKILSEI